MLQLSQSFQRYIGLLLVKLTSLVVEYFSFVLSLDWFNVFWLKWLVTCNTWAAVTKSLFWRRSLNVVQLAYPQLNIQPNEVVFSNATYFEFCFDNFKAFWSIESFFLTLGKSLSLECLNGLISQTQPFDLIRICSRQIVHNRYQNVNLAEQEILKYWKSIKFCPPTLSFLWMGSRLWSESTLFAFASNEANLTTDWHWNDFDCRKWCCDLSDTQWM